MLRQGYDSAIWQCYDSSMIELSKMHAYFQCRPMVSQNVNDIYVSQMLASIIPHPTSYRDLFTLCLALVSESEEVSR